MQHCIWIMLDYAGWTNHVRNEIICVNCLQINVQQIIGGMSPHPPSLHTSLATNKRKLAYCCESIKALFKKLLSNKSPSLASTFE